MHAQERRTAILARLKSATGPVSATALANALSVSRQVIVGDIALLRASGSPIEATKAALVLMHNGQEVSRQELPLVAGEAEGTYEASIINIPFTTPALEDDHQLDLVLEITLSAGDPLTNNSCSWYYIDGGLTMVVG